MSRIDMSQRGIDLRISRRKLAEARAAERSYRKARTPGARRYYRITYEESIALGLQHRDFARGREDIPYKMYMAQGELAGRKLVTKVRGSR